MYLDGIFDMFNFFKKKQPKAATAELTEKERATVRKEPYVAVLETKVDKNNPANGYFELDWNSYFIDDLRKAGYTGVTEEEIVDKWFKALCQNILDEEQRNKVVRLT